MAVVLDKTHHSLEADRTLWGTHALSSTLVLTLGTFAVGTDAFVVAGFLPSMADALHVSSAAAGQSVTVFAMAYAVLAPILATATARVPRRALLFGALLTLSIANVGSAVASSLPILLASRALAAVGAAAYTPTASAVVAALVRPEFRARALSLIVGGLSVATAVGVSLGSVASHGLGWRAALEILALLCVLAAIGVLLIMPALPGSARVPLRTRLAILRRRGVMAVLPLTVLGMAASYTVYAYSIPALRAVGITESSTALALFVYGVGAVIGSLLSGYSTDRWGPVRVLTAGYLSMAIGLALLGWSAASGAPGTFAVDMLVLVWGASTWTQTPAQQHRLIAAAAQDAALVVSLNSSAIYLGIGLGTTLGAIALAAGPSAMFSLGTLLAVSALILLAVTARVSPPQP